ncbi:MAG: hypothetical protein N2504_03865 [candidate division WOR-3 bacterium]|nr:hypothetical protein [candidate division WOR-3 bacterium]MCX7947705.1 hypothetical protein [candidate division WOR-3 bacterium]MDW8150582.1 hypothetical protein [candidate division WOR-3 bacterium]
MFFQISIDEYQAGLLFRMADGVREYNSCLISTFMLLNFQI